MGELKRFDVEMNGDDLIIDEAPEGEWVRYEDLARVSSLKRYNHYDQPGTDAAQAIEEPDGKWVRLDDVQHFVAAAGELRPVLDIIKKKDAEIARLTAQKLKAAGSGGRGYLCPGCGTSLTMCLRHGPYLRTDENQCGACRRGEP